MAEVRSPQAGAPRRRHIREKAVLAVAGVLAVAAGGYFVLPSDAAASAAPVAGATFTLASVRSGLCADVTGAQTADSAKVQQWDCTGAAWQRFTLRAAGAAGQLALVNGQSGKCLDVPGGSTNSDVQLVQYRCTTGAANQLFTFSRSGGGYQLKNVKSGLCVSVRGATRTAGTAIIQETCTGNTNKQWVLATTAAATPVAAGRQVEDLDRGLISVRSGGGNLVSWRLLGTDPAATGFTVYRGATKVTATPVTGSTNFLDRGAAADATYTVRPVVGGVEQAASGPSLRFTGGDHLDVPLQVPAGGTTPRGEKYTYSANDTSTGDLDGDGDLDLVVKWDPSNSKDNSQAGYTGNVFLDAYTLQGSRLWRIDLGRNVRAGAHYTQFQVYDYDGDGRAEVVLRTADGTRDGAGKVIGSATADHRNSSGYVLSGPEFLTAFDGRTGAALSTVDYTPARGAVSSWGDPYGNRVDRFLAATAYLDGNRPSVIMSRGYYTRSVIVAWDFRNGALTRRWTFDTNTAGSKYAGQGNHQMSVADTDADGRDEIIFGSLAIDDDGKPLWTTGYGHGDALHVGDLDPSRPGQEVFKVDEDKKKPASWFADARTGAVLWRTPANGDNGRGVSGDVYAGSPGAESWSAANPSLMNTRGAVIGRKPAFMNFLIWWDADPVRELLDGNKISKYGPAGDARLLTADGSSNNGTKANPALSGDVLGDWREELVLRTADSRALRIYSTPIPTTTKLYTLLHDTQYRTALAWQNTAYNQPPHPSYFLGAGMTAPKQPAVSVAPGVTRGRIG